MTRALLQDIAEKRPENLLLAGTPELLAFAGDGGNDADLRRAALAELVARWCLSAEEQLEKSLAEAVGESWRAFVDWYRVERPWTGERTLPERPGQWKDPPGLPGFESVLRRRLQRLFAADGFIPVCSGASAWFIPFAFDDAADGAVWSDGAEIAAWSGAVREALAGTGRRGIRLQLRDGAELSRGVEGRSLMLPVRMAALRGKKDGLPLYDPLRVLATGEFDGNFQLRDVKLAPKFEAAKKQLPDAVFFAPDVPGAVDRTERAFHPLDAGLDEKAVFGSIRDALERTCGCLYMTRDYALRRLPDMRPFVDRENHGRWSEVADQLERLEDAVARRRNPEEWLEFHSLLATALCHAGRTEESKARTGEAMAFARKHGFTAKVLRLQVTAAVNAQDLGEMEEYRLLAAGLEAELEAFDGPERDDLLMRHHGTAAQANVFGAVNGLDGFSAAAAKTHAGKALALAEAIACRAATPEAREEAEANVAQDLNYRHLVLALFEPGTAEEEEAWADARRQLRELPGKTRRNNDFYQKHQKSLAFFNAWLRTGTVPARELREDSRIVKSDEVEGWMVAANRRHLGALAAAAGETEEALSCFREGDAALPLEKCDSSVLASIRFALLVQAACSLRAAGETDEAQRFAVPAEETFSKFGESKLFRVIHAKRWLNALRGAVGPCDLPAFYY